MSQDIAFEAKFGQSALKALGVAFFAVLACHVAVDTLAAMVPATLGLLEARLQLDPKQTAWLLGLGSLCSGLSQPTCALLSDRLRTRQLGIWGIALGGIGIGLLGRAESYFTLSLLYAAGMIGIGMFHPIGASTIGQLRQHNRTSAVSLFFVAGMVGGALGAKLWPQLLAIPGGFQYLPLVVLPMLALAGLFHWAQTGLVPLHESTAHAESYRKAPAVWSTVIILYVAAALRFCVNLALFYLYVRLAQQRVALVHPDWTKIEIARLAAPVVGNLNAATLVGMGIGGLSAGLLVRSGKEKLPLVYVPICFAPLVGLLPYTGELGGYLLATMAGIGFAAMIPVTIALAQQTLPRHTNLASGMMMGGAWAVAMLGPRFAEVGVKQLGLPKTFVLTAFTLALSGGVCLFLRGGREK